jgi:TetR/AcrR family transcriptional repressor of nem operon
VRYDEGHKRETRRRIIESAARRFKTDGIDGAGIALLMKDAGLTNGAFYKHFDSKDDLISAAVDEQLTSQRAVLGGLDEGIAGLRQFIRAYLSVEHRDDVAGGCPSAALLDEIARCADSTRDVYTDGMVPIVDDLAARLGRADPEAARVEIVGLFAAMVGTLQISRALSDPSLADAVLEQGVRNALSSIE